MAHGKQKPAENDPKDKISRLIKKLSNSLHLVMTLKQRGGKKENLAKSRPSQLYGKETFLLRCLQSFMHRVNYLLIKTGTKTMWKKTSAGKYLLYRLSVYFFFYSTKFLEMVGLNYIAVGLVYLSRPSTINSQQF